MMYDVHEEMHIGMLGRKHWRKFHEMLRFRQRTERYLEKSLENCSVTVVSIAWESKGQMKIVAYNLKKTGNEGREGS